MILLCDGTRHGLLTALFYAEALRPRAQEILMEPPTQTDLFDPPRLIPTEPEKAARVWKAIRRKLPAEAEWTFTTVALSGDPNRGSILLRYLRRGWEVGRALHTHLADPDVWAALRLRRKVEGEAHLMKGLVRFRRVGDVYYAALRTDHDLLELLAPHFADRLGGQHWILHDLQREKACVFRAGGQSWVYLPLPGMAEPGDEADPFRGLWRAYHRAIAIRERVNPALQRQHMPRRYWAQLPEMEDLP